MIKKEDFERMCRKADMAPVMKGNFAHGEVCIADGFTKHPVRNFGRAFGVERGDFPSGCYATVWALFQDEVFVVADAVFFDPLHDLAMASRQDGRVRVAMERAEKFAETMEKVLKDPISDKRAQETESFFSNMEENNREFQEYVRKTHGSA